MPALTWYLLLLPVSGVEIGHATLAPPRAVIRVDAALRGAIADLLANSPTFRAQWDAVISTPALHVTLEYRALPMRARAQTQFRRYSAGAVYLTIRIGDRDRARELIAHEMEHSRELLEGLPLRDRAAHRARDTWMDAAGRIETSRALRAEHVVRQELLAARRIEAYR